jgi:hypothetical protein
MMTDEMTTNAIHMMPDSKVIMRIERDRIWVDPDVAVDETAQKVIGLLESHIVNMVERAVAEERERILSTFRAAHDTISLSSSPAAIRRQANRPWHTEPGY